MKAIAKRGDSVWLVVEEDGADHARVLDLAQLKLFPPYPTKMILQQGDWEDVPEGEQPDLDSLVRGVDHMDARVRTDMAEPGGIGVSH